MVYRPCSASPQKIPYRSTWGWLRLTVLYCTSATASYSVSLTWNVSLTFHNLTKERNSIKLNHLSVNTDVNTLMNRTLTSCLVPTLISPVSLGHTAPPGGQFESFKLNESVIESMICQDCVWITELSNNQMICCVQISWSNWLVDGLTFLKYHLDISDQCLHWGLSFFFLLSGWFCQSEDKRFREVNHRSHAAEGVPASSSERGSD